MFTYFFNFVLVILVLLPFYINFRINSFVSTKKKLAMMLIGI